MREERKRQGLTRQELEEKAGLSKGYLSRIEDGKRYPGPAKLRDLAEALGTDESVLRARALEIAEELQPEPKGLRAALRLATTLGASAKFGVVTAPGATLAAATAAAVWRAAQRSKELSKAKRALLESFLVRAVYGATDDEIHFVYRFLREVRELPASPTADDGTRHEMERAIIQHATDASTEQLVLLCELFEVPDESVEE